MKKLILPLIFAATAFGINAESETLKITFNNGKTQLYNVADISRISFEDGQTYQGDLLDIVFNPDGTATDISPLHNEVITKPGNNLMTYYSELHGRYVADFKNPMAGTVTDSYYRVNYTADGEFIRRIADGCTFETLIKLNETNPGTAEVKWFSSMQSGGIGFLLPTHNANNASSRCLTFLPNTNKSYRWTYSDVEPEAGKYYHVVGVWNKTEGKSYIYINGRLAGTAAAPGDYTPVSTGAESFIIGGDPANNQTTCTSSWNGEIVTTRIYDDPMDAAGVAELWEKAKFDENAQSVVITDLIYLPSCEVAPGYGYRVYGKGFAQGDKISFVNAETSAETTATTTIAADNATATIPASLTTGNYRLMLTRGNVKTPLCVVALTVSTSALDPVVPKVIAHRGAHTDGRPENSIAALEKAMDLNYYGIELDVWITSDGQVVINHDATRDGITIQSSTYDQLKNLTLSNGEKLPTFDSFVAAFNKKKATSTSKLIIEVKSHTDIARSKACVDKVIEIINANGLKDRVEFIAFDFEVCRYIHSKDADYIIGYLNGDRTPALCKVAGILSIDYRDTVLNAHPEYIAAARKLGMIVNVWTIYTASEMMKYWGMGVNYITTDSPAVLAELTKKTFIIK